MKIQRRLKVGLVLVLAGLMSHLPHVAVAEMVGTDVLVQELSGAANRQELSSLLGRNDVREQLIQRGVSPAEVETRIAALSDTEVQNLHSQIQEARAGGDILITVLLVL